MTRDDAVAYHRGFLDGRSGRYQVRPEARTRDYRAGWAGGWARRLWARQAEADRQAMALLAVLAERW